MSTYTDTRLLIDNQWVDAQSGKTLDVLNPATGAVIGKVAHAGTVDLDRALAAAEKGFRTWRATSAPGQASSASSIPRSAMPAARASRRSTPMSSRTSARAGSGA